MEDINKRIAEVENKIFAVLGKEKDKTEVIFDIETFRNYINKAIEKGEIAIDTETDNSTDTIQCHIMGLCIFVPGLKEAYIPINHRDRSTKNRLVNQLTEDDLKNELTKLKDNKVKIIMHNGKFDYEVIKTTCDGIELDIYWDTMIAAQILDENRELGLKKLYVKECDPTQADYKLDELTNDVCYADLDPSIFALYAAHDSEMTYKLYLKQVDEFNKASNAKLFKLFQEIEMPVVKITAAMEQRGLYVDLELNKRLKEKYDKQLEEIDEKITKCLASFHNIIKEWRQSEEAKDPVVEFAPEKSKRSKDDLAKNYPETDPKTGKNYRYGKARRDILTDPIKLTTQQRSVLIYDVLEAPMVSQRKPRGTGKEILEAIKTKLEVELASLDAKYKKLAEERDIDFNMLVESTNVFYEDANDKITKIEIEEDLEEAFEDLAERYEEERIDKKKAAIKLIDLLIEENKTKKIISTYIKTMPVLANHWPDGIVRLNYRTLGAKTGRFSSGGKIHFLKNETPASINGLNIQGIPSKNHNIRGQFVAKPGYTFVEEDFGQQEPRIMAHVSQDENFKKALSLDENGKPRDIYAEVAAVLFGNKYEDNLEHHADGTFFKEGKERRKSAKTVLLATMYGMGSGTLATKLNISKKEAEEKLEAFYNGYRDVRTASAVSIQVGKEQGYVEDIKGRRRRLPDLTLKDFNAYYISDKTINDENPDPKITRYLEEIEHHTGNKDAINRLIDEAKTYGIIIKSNESLIRRAERQCFNARIQGSAATMTKKVMIEIDKDPILKKLDSHLVIQVHDEVIVECPIENAEQVRDRLATIMVNAGKLLGIVDIPFVCDPVIERRWGMAEMSNDLKEEYEDAIAEGKKQEEAIKAVCEEHKEFPEEAIGKYLKGETKIVEF